jgi:hypothetical protein
MLEFADRIRSGDIAVDLTRPVRLWARYVAESYGSAAYYVLMRGSILYVAAVVLYGLSLAVLDAGSDRRAAKHIDVWRQCGAHVSRIRLFDLVLDAT